MLVRDGINLVIIVINETWLKEAKSELEARYSIKVIAIPIPRDLTSPEAPSEVFEILK